MPAGDLDVGVLDIDELSDGLDIRLVPAPIVLGDDPKPADGVIVLLSGADRDDRLDASGVLGDPDAVADRLDEKGVRLDDDVPPELGLNDDIATDEVPKLVVDMLWPKATVPDVSEVDVLVEMGAPDGAPDLVGSQGSRVGAWAVGPVAGPVCIAPGG